MTRAWDASIRRSLSIWRANTIHIPRPTNVPCNAHLLDRVYRRAYLTRFSSGAEYSEWIFTFTTDLTMASVRRITFYSVVIYNRRVWAKHVWSIDQLIISILYATSRKSPMNQSFDLWILTLRRNTRRHINVWKIRFDFETRRKREK